MQRTDKLRTCVRVLAGAALLSSCASRVWMMVPAKVDLLEYQHVGIVVFDGEDEEMRRRATREFQQRVLRARPGIRLIELESLEAGHALDAVFTGSIEFSRTTPTIGVTSTLVEVQARAEVLGTLAVRLVETESGATVWMEASDRKATIARAGVDTEGHGSLDYVDEQGIRISMVAAMAEDITGDFRDQYFRKRQEDIPAHYEVSYSDGVEVYVPPDVQL